jgi:hypothetical protein
MHAIRRIKEAPISKRLREDRKKNAEPPRQTPVSFSADTGLEGKTGR